MYAYYILPYFSLYYLVMLNNVYENIFIIGVINRKHQLCEHYPFLEHLAIFLPRSTWEEALRTEIKIEKFCIDINYQYKKLMLDVLVYIYIIDILVYFNSINLTTKDKLVSVYGPRYLPGWNYRTLKLLPLWSD